MQIITREKQVGGSGLGDDLDDSLFDGEPIPREISPRAWLKEGDVHRTNVLTKTLETTRFFVGPQVCITRDDIRRTTWAGVVEERRLLLCESSGPRPSQFPAPRFERKAVADGDIWRYGIHVPVFATNGQQSVALNYVLEKDVLVEAIRVQGLRPSGGLEVFPSTVGSREPYGNGVTDGHGLIMVLGTEGRLYSSNSSAGGIHFPESALLNHEMPKVAAFDASECYSSGLLANYVSMDYLYVEGDSRAKPISPLLHIETWDMPLPIPEATARSSGSEVVVEVLKDADLESGKVVFGFDDPSVNITEVDILDFRKAIVKTDHHGLAGKRISFDVQTLFHRHYGEALIGEGDTSSV